MAKKDLVALGDKLLNEFSSNFRQSENPSFPACTDLIAKEDLDFHLAVKNMPNELFGLSELSLEERMKKSGEGKYDRTLGLVKILFWDEYRRAVATQTPMILSHTWSPLVSKLWWKKYVLDNPLNLAWLMAPPADEIAVQKEMLKVGLNRLREVMELPLREKVKTSVTVDGEKKEVYVYKTNVSLIKEIHSIVKTMQDRVHGSITQKHQITSQNLNVNVEGQNLNMASLDLTLDQLEEYERKLNAIEGKILTIAATDVTEGDSEGYQE